MPVPKEEWVAVPVPDAGVPKAWVDGAREALKKNERPSFNSERFWELSGGIVGCGCCGWAMGTTTVSSEGLYYRCRRRIMYGKDVCDMKKHRRADLVEPPVWECVSEVLGEPERLRRGLQRMLEKEQKASVVDHEEAAARLAGEALRDRAQEGQLPGPRRRGSHDQRGVALEAG